MKLLYALIFAPLACAAMQPDTANTLRDRMYYTGHLPQEINQELIKFFTNNNQDPASTWATFPDKPKTTLNGHTDSVRALAFGPEGILASGSSDNTIKIWDIKSGTCTNTLTGHNDWVNALAFDSPGILASGSDDHTIKIWDIKTGTCSKTLTGHNNWVRALAFGPGGILASGSEDNTIKMWDIKSGICSNTLDVHKGSVLALAFDPNGILASGSIDNTIKIWNRDTSPLSIEQCSLIKKVYECVINKTHLNVTQKLLNESQFGLLPKQIQEKLRKHIKIGYDWQNAMRTGLEVAAYVLLH